MFLGRKKFSRLAKKRLFRAYGIAITCIGFVICFLNEVHDEFLFFRLPRWVMNHNGFAAVDEDTMDPLLSLVSSGILDGRRYPGIFSPNGGSSEVICLYFGSNISLSSVGRWGCFVGPSLIFSEICMVRRKSDIIG